MCSQSQNSSYIWIANEHLRLEAETCAIRLFSLRALAPASFATSLSSYSSLFACFLCMYFNYYSFTVFAKTETYASTFLSFGGKRAPCGSFIVNIKRELETEEIGRLIQGETKEMCRFVDSMWLFFSVFLFSFAIVKVKCAWFPLLLLFLCTNTFFFVSSTLLLQLYCGIIGWNLFTSKGTKNFHSFVTYAHAQRRQTVYQHFLFEKFYSIRLYNLIIILSLG